jgi:hypothetical protein
MSVARSRALDAFISRIRQWAAEGRADLLLAEAARLHAQGGGNDANKSGRSIRRAGLDQIGRILALGGGPESGESLYLLISLIAPMPAQLREWASMLASSQEPEAVIALIERHRDDAGQAEFLRLLMHETILHGFDARGDQL